MMVFFAVLLFFLPEHQNLGIRERDSSLDSYRNFAPGPRWVTSVPQTPSDILNTPLVGDTCKRAQTPGCRPLDDLCQDGDLEFDFLRDAQPLEAGQRVGNDIYI